MPRSLQLRPFDLDAVCEQVGRLRGRPLVRVPLPDAAGGQAMYVRGADVDYLVHSGGSSGLHRTHLVLHGLAHLLFEHRGHPAVMRRPQLELLMPLLDVATLAALRRSVYTPDEELQAEAFAMCVLLQAHSWGEVPAAGGHGPVLARLSAALERRPAPALVL